MISLITPSHYQTICGWWKAHNWPVLPEVILPKRGYISVIEDKPIIAGWLYKDETAAFGMAEWIVSNPESTREERDQGFKELTEYIEAVAREIGIKILMSTSNNTSLIGRFETIGFRQGNTNVTELFKEIPCQLAQG